MRFDAEFIIGRRKSADPVASPRNDREEIFFPVPEQNGAAAISTLWPRQKTLPASHVWSRITNCSCVPMIAPSLYESAGFHPVSDFRRTGGYQMLDLFSLPTPHR